MILSVQGATAAASKQGAILVLGSEGVERARGQNRRKSSL